MVRLLPLVVTLAGGADVAVLLVGSDKRPGYDGRVADLHFSAMRDTIVDPLKASVFVVSDACPSAEDAAAALPTLANLARRYFGGAVAGFGAVAPPHRGPPRGAADRGDCAVLAAGPRQKPWIQWYRLERCWALMVAREADRGRPYDAVIKLRADATPANFPTAAAFAGLSARPKTVHAATDHVFWGDRASMAVACATYASIDAVFRGSEKEATFLPFGLAEMRDSLDALHTDAYDKRSWQSYSKFAVLPFPRALPGTGAAPADARANLAAALSAGAAYARGDAFGAMANAGDMQRGTFVTEKDFLVWLLYNNVTVCDLDGTDAYLYKGKSIARPTLPCPG